MTAIQMKIMRDKEVLGGRGLIADGVVLFVLGITFPIVAGGFDAFLSMPSGFFLALLTIFLPPLVAGSLFLACHRNSK